jgi:hypothetical protein
MPARVHIAAVDKAELVQTAPLHYQCVPPVQILVFSAWQDVLDLLHHDLATAAVPHLYGKGKPGLSKALASFTSASDSGATLKDADVTAKLTAPAPSTAAAAGASTSARGGGAVSAVQGALARGSKRKATDAAAEAAPRVLLLLLKQAAAGLNLTEAQHALLVEPSTNPSTEAQVRTRSCRIRVELWQDFVCAVYARTVASWCRAVESAHAGCCVQAVARIHRMNQKRETQVIRFVVNDSVEAALHSLTAAKAAKMDMSMATPSSSNKGGEPPLSLSDVTTMLFDSQHVHADA